MEDPLGIAISHKGTILVVDGKNCSIREFTLDGKETQCIHPKESGLVSPTDIAVNRNTGHVYIVDDYINTVTVLNPDLTFSHNFPVFETELFGGPVAIAIDSKGLVYIAKYYNYRILKFTPEGQFVSSFTTQGACYHPDQLIRSGGIAIDDEEQVYVSDYDGWLCLGMH